MRSLPWACLVLAVGCLLGGCAGNIDDSDIRYATLDEVAGLSTRDAEKDDLLILIDPRPPAAFAESHLPRAVNIQLNEVADRYGVDPAISRHEHIIVYGADPGSAVARAMVKRMLTVGYSKKRVRWFQGGLREWSRAGFPLEP